MKFFGYILLALPLIAVNACLIFEHGVMADLYVMCSVAAFFSIMAAGMFLVERSTTN